MKKYNFCIDCQKPKANNTSTRCQLCFGKIHSKQMQNNQFAIKDGHTIKKYYCLDCKKELCDFRSTRCYSCENKRRHKLGILNNTDKNNFWYHKSRVGKKNPNYKSGKAKCKKCNKRISDYISHLCHNCWAKFHKGKNHNWWNGGISKIGYSYKFNEKLKELIRKRDNYTCNICQKYGNHVHHIDYNKENCRKNNLITVCLKCHVKTNYNRDYLYAYFRYIMENR